MGSIVGSSTALSTWGKFRCVWCLQLNYDVTSVTDYDITYGSGQKAAADGSGLIRWRPRPIVLPYGYEDLQPTIHNQAFTNFPPGPPPYPGGNRIYGEPLQVSATSPSGYESKAVTDEAKAELTGDTVTFTDSRTTTIDAIFWDEGRYTWDGPHLPPLVNAGDVVSIGKFTAF